MSPAFIGRFIDDGHYDWGGKVASQSRPDGYRNIEHLKQQVATCAPFHLSEKCLFRSCAQLWTGA